jgi:TPP-dependent 2-oxoacid decarboxylase
MSSPETILGNSKKIDKVNGAFETFRCNSEDALNLLEATLASQLLDETTSEANKERYANPSYWGIGKLSQSLKPSGYNGTLKNITVNVFEEPRKVLVETSLPTNSRNIKQGLYKHIGFQVFAILGSTSHAVNKLGLEISPRVFIFRRPEGSDYENTYGPLKRAVENYPRELVKKLENQLSKNKVEAFNGLLRQYVAMK